MEGQIKHCSEPVLMQDYKCLHCKDTGWVMVRSWECSNTFMGMGMVDVIPEECDRCQT